MFSDRIRRGALLAALAAAPLAVAGCATETTYHPATGVGFDRTGFSERQIEPNRWLVMFAGNTVTSRDTVERYLLFRAAQLTLQQGNDYFVMVDRDTDRQTRTFSTPGFGPYGGLGYGGFGYGLGGYWGPSWRFHRGGFGWGGWGYGGFGDPFWGGGDVETVDRVEAEAQIVMRRGAIPTGNVRAFDAHRVVATLGPTIVLPGQEKNHGRPNPGTPGYGPQPGYGPGPNGGYGPGPNGAPNGSGYGPNGPAPAPNQNSY